MSADRELLELAAKAAGFGLHSLGMGKLGLWVVRNPELGKDDVFIWDPLTDDGDALRLATRLCMSVSTGPCRAAANTIPGALRGAFFVEDTCQQDQDYAVRRVIVRAAADVGEHMP